MKSSKAQITAKFHKIPAIRFEDQQLTSFSGLLIFQLLFKRLNLKQRLKKLLFAFGYFTNLWPPSDRIAAHCSSAYRFSTPARS